MTGEDETEQTESLATSMSTPQTIWTTVSQTLQPRPATIHEGFSYSLGSDFGNFASWQQDTTSSESMSRPVSMHQDFYPSSIMDSSHWNQKPLNEGIDLQLDTDMYNIGQALTADEAIPIMNLRFSNGAITDSDPLPHFDDDLNPRRLSESSFTVSTSGCLSDMPSYDDFSAALSDAPSFCSDYPPPSNRNSLMSSTHLSPVASPRLTPHGRSEFVRTHSRGRASPSPRPSSRAVPYSVDGLRSKRWSTGTYGTQQRRLSPFVYHGQNGLNQGSSTLDPFGGHRLAMAPSSGATGRLPLNVGNLQQAAIAAAAAANNEGPMHNFYLPEQPAAASAAAAASAVASASGYTRHSMLLPTQLPSQTGAMAFHYPHSINGGGFPGSNIGQQRFQGYGLPPQHTVPSQLPLAQLGSSHGLGSQQPQQQQQQPLPPPPPPPPQPLLSQGLFRMLQSNGDAHGLHGHYATDMSEPPDLYSSLNEEHLSPPPEDRTPEDAELVPHEQELRFRGDLYTPKWVRGHGNKREGWCGLCKPGRWLVLKNSAFWYDKSFTHGISAATGSPFQEPLEMRRMDGNPDVWEGLCSSCTDWIPLVSSKKKGTTWFRHAYKCHAHPKAKDVSKRRRENNHSRTTGTTSTTTAHRCGSAGSGDSEVANKRQRSDNDAPGVLERGTEDSERTTPKAPPQQPLPIAYTVTPPPPAPPPPQTPLPPLPQTPLPPQSTTPASSTVATPTQAQTTNAGSLLLTPNSMRQMPIQTQTPATLEQQQQQQQSSSPSFPADFQQAQQTQQVQQTLQVQQMQQMQQAHQAQQPLQQQQHHQPQPLAQPLYFMHLPAQVPPPSYAPPPVPPRSHLRIQRQMARLESLKQQQPQQHQQQQQQQQQQQRLRLPLQIQAIPPPSRPPPPTPQQTQSMVTGYAPPTPMMEGLGNVI